MPTDEHQKAVTSMRNDPRWLGRGARGACLVALMVVRRWLPTAAERQTAADRAAWRARDAEQRKVAAAAFRWTILQIDLDGRDGDER